MPQADEKNERVRFMIIKNMIIDKIKKVVKAPISYNGSGLYEVEKQFGRNVVESETLCYMM